MNTYKNVIDTVRSRTYIFFFFSLMFYILLSTIVSFFNYKMVSNDYNTQFYYSYIVNNTILFVFNNLTFYAISCFIILYSMIIRRDDLINKENTKVLFSDIIISGIYVLILLTLLLFLGEEFIIPQKYQKLHSIKSDTKISNNLLKLGNDSYEKSDFEQALKYYTDYISIINNGFIKDRVRELKVKIANDELKKRQDLDNLRNSDYLSADDLDYIQLAKISYDKADYLGALYYYQYVVETYKYSKRQSNLRDEAEKKIKEIKNILQFQDSMLTDEKFQDKINQNLKDIATIYNLKKEAEIAKSKEDYFSAYFLYSDILKIKNDLRDIIQERNDIFYKIALIGVDYNSINNAKLLPFKDNILFMYNSDILVSAKKMVRALDLGKSIYTYYLYDVRFFKYDSKFDLNYVSYAPFGEIKNYNSIYDFLRENSKGKNITEYFEIPYIVNKKDFESFLSRLTEDDRYFILSVYTASDNKYKIIKNISENEKSKIRSIFINSGYDLFNFFNNAYFLTLFSASTSNENEEFIPIPEILSKDSYISILKSLSNESKDILSLNYTLEDDDLYYIKEGYDVAKISSLIKESGYNVKKDLFGTSEKNYIFPLSIAPSILYDFSFGYKDILKLSFSQLIRLKQWITSSLKENVNNGYSYDIIGSAVAYKISSIFLFFSLSLLAMSLAWRFRSGAIGVSFGYYFYAIFIPFFVYVVVSLCNIFNTKLYSALMQVLPFGAIFTVSLVLNIIFATFSVMVVASTS